MESVNIFSEKFHNIIEKSVDSVLLEGGDKEETSFEDHWRPTNENDPSCSYCRIQFSDLQSQREHYKLDWHRYNLKQSLESKTSITEEQFNEKSEKDDLSSISGSDTEPESTLDTYATAQGKMFLQSGTGQVFSIYRCLLFDRKEEVADVEILKRLQTCCSKNKQWTVFMLGGGHFAGAVFQETQPILHKTFHCYTVRAGQGGSQSSRDGKSGGSQPKSAGASLRRYNEQALIQHVKNIVDSWRPEIEKSSLIIYRASGPYNRAVLFGGNTPLLDRSDKRLRTIPFSTRRATFTEVQRKVLLNILHNKSLLKRNPKRNKIRASCINRAKSRETTERPLPGTLSSASSSEVDLSKIDNVALDNDLAVSDCEFTTDHLEEFGDSLTPEQRKKSPKKKKPPKKSKTKKLREHEEARKKESSEEEDKIEKVKSDFVNEVLDDYSNTLLHIAALNEHEEVVKFLLENDADPCLKNKNQQTAYVCTQSKLIRETLKQFAKDNPEKYNYNKV
ncbi:hypothetical protein NQ317_001547 [Molorchus minor]|uniref:VLRF1 domain-containing protein n=1 Tax=Molorchus minor TaxID=1323400 RepID=A0ABQ9J2J3_9CUCU|nr:hypothetical protein NQ317_001547 [Molorchus minor]